MRKVAEKKNLANKIALKKKKIDFFRNEEKKIPRIFRQNAKNADTKLKGFFCVNFCFFFLFSLRELWME